MSLNREQELQHRNDELLMKLAAAKQEKEQLRDALEKWMLFWDEMPKGQLGKIVCDIGLLNEAFMATTKSLAATKGV